MALRAGAVGAVARKRAGGEPNANKLRPKSPKETAKAEPAKLATTAKKKPAKRISTATTRRPTLKQEERLTGWQEMLGTSAGRMQLAEELLRVRAKSGTVVPLRANTVQREFERRRGTEDIVLKARQMGLSTWVAGQFFLRTILVPGTVTLQVAHTREAAMGLFRAVHRMWLGLDPALRKKE